MIDNPYLIKCDRLRVHTSVYGTGNKCSDDSKYSMQNKSGEFFRSL
jgi:hypothetical protein